MPAFPSSVTISEDVNQSVAANSESGVSIQRCCHAVWVDVKAGCGKGGLVSAMSGSASCGLITSAWGLRGDWVDPVLLCRTESKASPCLAPDNTQVIMGEEKPCGPHLLLKL